ncbi:MAG: hypothetical protein ACI9FR_002572 [Cryomorphaceae bacterium]
MTKILKGACLCGAVQFSVKDNFKAFYQCHCKQCQQLTGSAFASNLLTETDNIEWAVGGENVQTFEHPTREFSKSFCAICGSALPFVNKPKTSLIVPAGSLFDVPTIKLQANIFTAEQACWFEGGLEAKNFDAYPQ